MRKPIDLQRLTKPELKNLLENARRLGRNDLAVDVLKELTARGGAKSEDYAILRWNQESVRKALEPFVAVSKSVPDNQRTTYTQAGGRKIGRSKADPEWMWVDSYTAIKTPKVNALIVGYVPRPGDDAYFELHMGGLVLKRFEADQLDEALAAWTALATEHS